MVKYLNIINDFIHLLNFSRDVERNGEPSTSTTDDHDETDFSMASLAKGEVTQVKSTLGTMLNFSISFYIKQIDILLCNLQYCRPSYIPVNKNTNLRFRV